jgi:hypothetical protein
MELSLSQANSHLATEEFFKILWNPKVHYCVHKGTPLVPVMSQINPIHITRSYISKTILNITFHLNLGLPSGLFPYGFPTKILYAFLFSRCVPHALPISSPLTWHFLCIWRKVQIMKHSMQFPPTSYCFIISHYVK